MNPWFAILRDAMKLGLEAQSVVALRLARFGHGGKFDAAEARRMVMEKGQALAQAQVAAAFALLGGGRAPAIAKKTIGIYAQRVRRNRRRLSRRRRVSRRALR